MTRGTLDLVLVMYDLKPQIQPSLTMHGITGIDAQIHHDLLQLYRLHIDTDPLIIRQGIKIQLNSGWQGGTQHLYCFFD